MLQVGPGDCFLVAVTAYDDVLVGVGVVDAGVDDGLVEGDAGGVMVRERPCGGLSEELVNGISVVVDGYGIGFGLGLGDVEGADAPE